MKACQPIGCHRFRKFCIVIVYTLVCGLANRLMKIDYAIERQTSEGDVTQPACRPYARPFDLAGRQFQAIVGSDNAPLYARGNIWL